MMVDVSSCIVDCNSLARWVNNVSSAFEETRNEKAIRIAMNMIEDGKLPLEMVAQYCELPLEKVEELAKQKTA